MCFQRESRRVDIYVNVFPALTLANDLLHKALMKLSISMFDILLPSQHLVFVFGAPKWLLMRPASVPALWKGNVQASRRACYSPIRISESSSFSCFNFLPARTGVISLITWSASARHSRRVSALAAAQTCLPLCAHFRRDPYPFQLFSISSRTTAVSCRLRDGERDIFCHCRVTLN